MKDRAIALALSTDVVHRKNILREYLQAQILHSMQTAGTFQFLVFQGGTALRFLYALKRFSEDLDFAIEKQEGFILEKMKLKIMKDLEKGGFQLSCKENKRKTVYVLSIRVQDILFESGVSQRKEEKLNVHIEIDMNPPKGGKSSVTLVNRHFLLSLRHHDLPSAMAGKCHAIFMRPYTKGRDLYDLLWYLTQDKRIEPNLTFLNNALRQTHWKGPTITSLNWKKELLKKMKLFSWENIRKDISPFLEIPEEQHLITFENFKKLLKH